MNMPRWVISLALSSGIHSTVSGGELVVELGLPRWLCKCFSQDIIPNSCGNSVLVFKITVAFDFRHSKKFPHIFLSDLSGSYKIGEILFAHLCLNYFGQGVCCPAEPRLYPPRNALSPKTNLDGLCNPINLRPAPSCLQLTLSLCIKYLL